jgi:hypothetical protein
LEEDEPEETHWDKGTQTEDVILAQDLPPKEASYSDGGKVPMRIDWSA